MPRELPRMLIDVDYYQAAQDYLHSLPLEHFMEATPHATQRKIALESFDLVKVARPDVHFFNELLVQYPIKGQRKPGQVVPDNMVVLHDGPVNPEGSYDLPLQPARPFMMLEYVSRSNRRKDYNDNMVKYEQQLKVRYYLLFRSDVEELILYRHNRRKYVRVKPNEHERLDIPDLEMEVALFDDWVRFWFRGNLLPLPAEMLRELAERDRQLTERDRQLAEERQARLAGAEELSRLRAEIERLRHGTAKDS